MVRAVVLFVVVVATTGDEGALPLPVPDPLRLLLRAMAVRVRSELMPVSATEGAAERSERCSECRSE